MEADVATEGIIYADDHVFAIVARHNWKIVKLNTLVIPRRHIENLYGLPNEFALPIHRLSRALARAIRAVTNCDGISVRQNNEPWGSQDIWHYHMHVTPRYENDEFYELYHSHQVNVEAGRQAKELAEFLKQHPEVFQD